MIRVIPLVALLVLSGFSLCSAVKEVSWQGLLQKADKLSKEGKYNEAIAAAKKALAVAENSSGKDHPYVAKVITTLGWIYENQKKYAIAESLYKRSLEIWEKNLSGNQPELAEHLDDLRRIYEKQGKYADAEPLAKRELEILKAKLGPDDPYVHIATTNLATILEEQGKKREAYELLKAARLIPGEESAEVPPRVASAPQKSSPLPSVTIHSVKVKPSTVRGGERLTLSVIYSVANSSAREGRVPVQISYSLRQGGVTVAQQRPVTQEVQTGKELTTEKKIGSPRKPGSYELGVRIQSKGATVEKSVPLHIK